MTDLEGQIRYWKSTLHNYLYLMTPATEALIIGTIKSLKELQQLKAGEK